MNSQDISMTAVRECLERSGYLLESRLVQSLDAHGFFVEPNQVIRDRRTGKAREVDIVAEYQDPAYYDAGVGPRLIVKTVFVIEAINNRFPLVLLTQRPWSPKEDPDSHLNFICTPEPSPFIQKLDWDALEARVPERSAFYAQYCVLTAKGGNRELMASHSDDLYGSLQKLSEYVDDEMEVWQTRELQSDERFWRLFFWRPMLVLGGRLITVSTGADGGLDLREATSGYLEFNWHSGDESRTTVVEVVTADVLLERVKYITQLDAQLLTSVRKIRDS